MSSPIELMPLSEHGWRRRHVHDGARNYPCHWTYYRSEHASVGTATADCLITYWTNVSRLSLYRYEHGCRGYHDWVCHYLKSQCLQPYAEASTGVGAAMADAADIWRQCDVGMTFDSDVGLTLQEGWIWKFSRRRILVGLVATNPTKNQPDSNVFTTSCACWESNCHYLLVFDYCLQSYSGASAGVEEPLRSASLSIELMPAIIFRCEHRCRGYHGGVCIT